MIVNLIGDCDKRPVIYTLMKIFQTLGDVLLVTNNSYLRKLSNTGESGGHFQNVMIAFTNEGVGDFFENFRYDYDDFMHVILDGVIEAEADLTIHCCSMIDSESTKDSLEYMDNCCEISIWNNKGASAAYVACEKFESYRCMIPMPLGIIQAVANVVSQPLKASMENVIKIASAIPPGSESLKPQHRAAVKPNRQAKGSMGMFGKKGGR